MAEDVTIGGDGALFVGEDKTLKLEVLDADDVPVDITGWAITLDVRTRDNAADPALLSKSASITGTYSSTRASNTQRAVATLADDDTVLLTAKTYRHSWKRTTAGNETILAYGDFVVERATQM